MNLSKIIAGEVTYFDIETTDVSVARDDITRITILQEINGHEVFHWARLIRPTKPISDGAAKVSGITNDMVEHAPTFNEIAAQLVAILNNTNVVCHYGLKFDIPFLARHIETAGIKMNTGILDTWVWAKHIMDVKKYGMLPLAEEFGLLGGLDRADPFYHCRLNARLLKKLVEMDPRHLGAGTVADAIEAQSRILPE